MIIDDPPRICEKSPAMIRRQCLLVAPGLTALPFELVHAETLLIGGVARREGAWKPAWNRYAL